MTDARIVALYWDRDESAVEHTRVQYGKHLRRIAYQILASYDDSIEVENDTYLAAWNSMPTHRPTVLSTYLGRIARQTAIDCYRKSHAQKRRTSLYTQSLSELEEVLPTTETSESLLEAKELSQAINRFLGTLDEKTRLIFIGRYFYCDDLKKIAGYCHMREANVKTVLFRTRTKLMEFLKSENYVTP